MFYLTRFQEQIQLDSGTSRTFWTQICLSIFIFKSDKIVRKLWTFSTFSKDFYGDYL